MKQTFAFPEHDGETREIATGTRQRVVGFEYFPEVTFSGFVAVTHFYPDGKAYRVRTLANRDGFANRYQAQKWAREQFEDWAARYQGLEVT